MRRQLMGTVGVVVSLVGLGALVGVGSNASPPAHASTFPGTNGKIAFTSGQDGISLEVFSMNADGTGQTNLTNDPGIDDSCDCCEESAEVAALC